MREPSVQVVSRLDSMELPEGRPEDAGPGDGALFGMMRILLENRLALLALAVILAVAFFSFVGPFLYHTNQIETNIFAANLPPGKGHPLGTDQVGYDILGRLMLGGQSSLEVGIAAALIAALIGTAWGSVSGFRGGVLDAVMMRVLDSFLAIPAVLLVLLLGTIFVPSVPMLILVLGFVSWLITARLVRGETLSLRTRDYVEAARVVGARRGRILLRHIVPNAVGTIVVQTTFEVANAILLLAALSFLGLGPPPPAANWGSMLTDGLQYFYDGYWWEVYPAGIAIVVTVAAFNVLGEALRDALDTRLVQR